MRNIFLAQILQGRHDLISHIDGLPFRQLLPVFFHVAVQTAIGAVFEHYVDAGVGLETVLDADYVGAGLSFHLAAETGQDFDLALYHPFHFLPEFFEHGLADDLDRHFLRGVLVDPSIDIRKSALSEQILLGIDEPPFAALDNLTFHYG
jgi:hypothetical protein